MRKTPRATAPARLRMPRAPCRTPRKWLPNSFLRPELPRTARTPQEPQPSPQPKPLLYTEPFSSFSPYEIAASWWFPDPRVTSGLTLKRLCKQEAGLMFVRRRNSNINRRQKRENVRLNDRHKNMKPNEGQRNNCRKYSQSDPQGWRLVPSPNGRLYQQPEKDYIEQVAGKNVRPKTHGQRKNARRGTDEFDRKKQNAQQPVAQLPWRPSKRKQ